MIAAQNEGEREILYNVHKRKKMATDAMKEAEE